MKSHRKFQTGDLVKVTKQGRYNALQGEVGTVQSYRLRKYAHQIGGSCYVVDFGVLIGQRTVETEYLTKVEMESEGLCPGSSRMLHHYMHVARCPECHQRFEEVAQLPSHNRAKVEVS